jgi:hypothetical protein
MKGPKRGVCVSPDGTGERYIVATKAPQVALSQCSSYTVHCPPATTPWLCSLLNFTHYHFSVLLLHVFTVFFEALRDRLVREPHNHATAFFQVFSSFFKKVLALNSSTSGSCPKLLHLEVGIGFDSLKLYVGLPHLPNQKFVAIEGQKFSKPSLHLLGVTVCLGGAAQLDTLRYSKFHCISVYILVLGKRQHPLSRIHVHPPHPPSSPSLTATPSPSPPPPPPPPPHPPACCLRIRCNRRFANRNGGPLQFPLMPLDPHPTNCVIASSGVALD